MGKAKKKQLTPMMRQYMSVKDQYPDAVVFFRMGDFFEMFFDDAKLASRVLDIALTHRNKMDDNPIPMAGIPHHAHRNYINKLVDEGHTVVICDQVEDAKLAKGLVRREVTRIVTPGMVLDPDALASYAHHYLLAAFFHKRKCGLAMLDLTTGDFRVTEVPEQDGLAETQRVRPREVLLCDSQLDLPLVQEYQAQLDQVFFKSHESRFFQKRDAYQRLCEHFEVASLEGFGVQNMDLAVRAAGALFSYVQETQKANPTHISRLIPYSLQEHMVIDEVTRSNLELMETLRERSRKGSLFGLLDRSRTPMGGRKIRHWLLYPLLQQQRIQRRLDVVDLFYQQSMLREDLRETLKQMNDIERLNGKISSGLATPRDLGLLSHSIQLIPQLLQQLHQLGDTTDHLGPLASIDPMTDITEHIQTVLVDEPPTTLKDGGVIRKGFHNELDELRDIAANGKDRILEMEANERQATGIQSLKIKFNRVFGYFLEVSKPNLHLVPDHYQRKQTMANHERYITTELKEFEEKILNAEERSLELELQLFETLRQQLAEHGPRIATQADRIGQLDALTTFAELSVQYDYCKPTITETPILHIEQGRHPVVEQTMQADEFVPNTLDMSVEKGKFILLTGPNMAGKSTIMRQTALMSILAQIGCFVPAQSATLGICDRVFTRVGASDNLAGGQSTFMVEMTETSNILHNATEKSLVILDEIGRGTSTFDGISIAWAVAEYLHNRLQCRTLFATHYHELTELESSLEQFRNMSIAIQEENEEILFLHKLVEGGANRSYGVQVARLAGLPRAVVRRAHHILAGLEQGKLPSSTNIGGLHAPHTPENQLSLFQATPTAPAAPSFVEEELSRLDIHQLSPMQALQLLYDWKERVEEQM